MHPCYLEPVDGVAFEFVDGLVPVVAVESVDGAELPWFILGPIRPWSPSIPFRPIFPCSIPSRIIRWPMPGPGLAGVACCAGKSYS